MAILQPYTTGTVSVTADATTVTGSGTAWKTAGFQAGDQFWAAGLTVTIATVDSDTQVTLASGWPGSTISGGSYELRAIAVGDRANADFIKILKSLASGNLPAIADLTSAADKLAYFTGAGEADLADLTAFGRSLLDDADAATARATMDVGVVAGYRNKIINGDFSINQRGATAKAQDVGVYGYDRWKGHADGLEQVIESLPAGDYTLTFGGGGTGSVDGAAAVASPAIFTVATSGDISVVVPTTATRVSLVPGDATGEDDPFSPRHVQQELALCQRYFCKSYSYSVAPGTTTPGGEGGYDFYFPTATTGLLQLSVRFPVEMRTIPTVVAYDSAGTAGKVYKGGNGKDQRIVGLGTGGATIGTDDPTNASEIFFQFTADAEF